ncbi:MAG: sce7725 family protein [Actinobacteria bacterium]|nr:sce7725 family protein [Actinomycetota bacterium]
MYYPFIRGKQFELVMLREMAPRIAEWGFVPIIEPVKGNFPALKKALDQLIEQNCRFIIITNPSVGELTADSSALRTEIFDEHLCDYNNFSIGFNLSATDTNDTAKRLFEMHDRNIAIIHNGFSDGKALSELIEEKNPTITEHVFVEQQSSTMLYRKHFKGMKRIIVKDGFESRINREYPPSEPFSELYLTFEDMGCDGFGDFLIVGSDFREGGGPAYAIAIHLTYADSDADDAIAIKHYISDQTDTPKDPAGKFLEALRKLVDDVRGVNSPVFRSTAIEAYMQLYSDQHFPGLGYVKKLSMQHHIELMAHLLFSEA